MNPFTWGRKLTAPKAASFSRSHREGSATALISGSSGPVLLLDRPPSRRKLHTAPRAHGIYHSVVAGVGSTPEFAQFQSRNIFHFDKAVSWFPSHMASALLKIKDRAKWVDCVVEVRDARAPFTSSNPEISSLLSQHCQRVVVLNKADLACPRSARDACAVIERAGHRAVLMSASQKKNVCAVRQSITEDVKQATFKTIGNWMMVLGLPNTGKSTIINAMKRLAVEASSRGRRGNKAVDGVKRTKAKAGRVPGLTREIGVFQISERPKLFCLDTPGIMVPKGNDVENNLKLAALGCVLDTWAGEMYVADYVLYRLNNERLFDYVWQLELPGPTNDIHKVASHLSRVFQKTRLRMFPQEMAGVRAFLDMFRNGKFGRFCLDDVPQAEHIAFVPAPRRTDGAGWGLVSVPQQDKSDELSFDKRERSRTKSADSDSPVGGSSSGGRLTAHGEGREVQFQAHSSLTHARAGKDGTESRETRAVTAAGRGRKHKRKVLGGSSTSATSASRGGFETHPPFKASDCPSLDRREVIGGIAVLSEPPGPWGPNSYPEPLRGL